MTSIQIVSDLHLELRENSWKEFLSSILTKAPLLIIAGDFCCTNKLYFKDALTFLSEQYENVVYVLGNHEYWGSSKEETERVMEKLGISNIHYLHNSTCKINGITFAGTPLWFKEEVDNTFYERMLNDFKLIKDFRSWVYDENRKSVEFLNTVKADAWITHHLPSQKSVHSKYKGGTLNRFFVCDIENIIIEKSPKLVVHGHTHDSFDYMIDNTRVLCNPYGYHGHTTNGDFKPVIVEI